jgi:hypothetical protein
MAVELACGWQNELVGADNGRRYATYFVPSRENLSAQLDFAFRFERFGAGRTAYLTTVMRRLTVKLSAISVLRRLSARAAWLRPHPHRKPRS